MLQTLLASVLFLGSAAALGAQSSNELALVRNVFEAIQPKSFAQNAEFCGYIGFDARGKLVATTAVKGGADWCEMDFPQHLVVVASYHTHAAYDPGAWSEIPSGDDMEGDEADGIDGYVATPGGRFWYIDTEDMTATQLCGIGCLPQDPRFQPAPEDDIQESYTYDDLIEKIED